MKRDWTLRRAERADAPHMASVVADAVWGLTGNAYTAAQKRAWVNSVRSDYFETLIALEQHDIWVAQRKEGVVAFGALHVDEVSYLYVSAACAGQGLGSQLLTLLEQTARRCGATELFVRSSLNARPFYERHGFKLVGRLMLVREGIAMPSLEMEKSLRSLQPGQ